MQLTPRYDDPTLLRIDVDLGDLAGASVRQRRRMADLLATFDEEQWAAPSRCEGWTSRDVVDHVATATGFWALSVDAGLAGRPTRIMETFDPVASPEALLDRRKADQEVLEGFVAANAALDAALDRIDDWSVPAEAPPGHLPLTAVVAHALWDAWTHERDIALPLGLDVPVAADEVRPALVYGAALGPTFGLTAGGVERGTLVVDATDPEVRVVVEVGDGVRVHDVLPAEATVTLTGDAVALLEALSYRAELEADVPDDGRWLVSGLGRVFDVA